MMATCKDGANGGSSVQRVTQVRKRNRMKKVVVASVFLRIANQAKAVKKEVVLKPSGGRRAFNTGVEGWEKG
jgi:hypothetical protein